jgi:hypothetical protein
MAVNLSPFAGAGWQFFDNNGVILSGGLLYTYAAGTTTPQTTYTSSSGATANSNPIVLDSAGRVSGEIWLTSNLSYKFVLNTFLGVTIGTYDNISSVQDSVTADIAALQAADTTFALKGANTDITSLASPALGAATATTQTAGDNTTKVATTAFVTTAVLAGAGSDIFSFPNPTVDGSGAMTLPVSTSSISLSFRSITATSGLATIVTGTPAALVIPNGATLGTTNAIQSIIIEVLINNAGTLERAVVNLAGGNDLSETGLINTTAIDASSDSANVFYSTTARTGVAYRVVRSITSTQATAGSWVTTPSAVQGEGGNALSAMSSLGYGQTWQNIKTASPGPRAFDTLYYNTTGKSIFISVEAPVTTTSNMTLFVNGLEIAFKQGESGSAIKGTIQGIIPPGATYQITTAGSPTLSTWNELR